MLAPMPRAKAFDPDVTLEHAVELFWRRGYEGTSMAQLLEFMGISRQSLYDTYGDKHTLFLSAVDRYRENLRKRFAEIIAEHDSPLAGLRAWVDHVLAEVIDHPDHRACMMANSALELGQRDPELRERVSEHLRDVEDAFAGVLERAQAAGEIDAGRDARALARFLTNSLHGLGVLARGGASRAMVHDSVETTMAVVTRGI